MEFICSGLDGKLHSAHFLLLLSHISSKGEIKNPFCWVGSNKHDALLQSPSQFLSIHTVFFSIFTVGLNFSPRISSNINTTIRLLYFTWSVQRDWTTCPSWRWQDSDLHLQQVRKLSKLSKFSWLLMTHPPERMNQNSLPMTVVSEL